MSGDRTGESQALFERAKRVSPGGVHSPVRGFRGVGGVPRFIRSAQGAELVDVAASVVTLEPPDTPFDCGSDR